MFATLVAVVALVLVFLIMFGVVKIQKDADDEEFGIGMEPSIKDRGEGVLENPENSDNHCCFRWNSIL